MTKLPITGGRLQRRASGAGHGPARGGGPVDGGRGAGPRPDADQQARAEAAGAPPGHRPAPSPQAGIWPRPPSAAPRVLGRAAALLGPLAPSGLALTAPSGQRQLLGPGIQSTEKAQRQAETRPVTQQQESREFRRRSPPCPGVHPPHSTTAALLDTCSPLLTPPQPPVMGQAAVIAPQSSCKIAEGHPCHLGICTQDVFG